MTTQEQYIERLKELVATKFGHAIQTHDDCIALSNALLESVGVGVDCEALEQLFTQEAQHVAPRPLVLSSLARYVGFTGWSDFCTAGDITPTESRYKLPTARQWGVIAIVVAIVAAIILSIVVLVRLGDDSPEAEAVDSRFRQVEQIWVARTSEHCNTLRAYQNNYAPASYNERVDRFIVRYESQLRKHVQRDIEEFALKNNVTVDNTTIEHTAEIIIDRCITMCENIKVE